VLLGQTLATSMKFVTVIRCTVLVMCSNQLELDVDQSKRNVWNQESAMHPDNAKMHCPRVLVLAVVVPQ
jgi:hypothetical protein